MALSWIFLKISIHTPAKGVTASSYAGDTLRLYFNPHSREGSDCSFFRSIGTLQISIHTPAKGVTKCGF